jgi:molybdate transport system ATP-binding protein
MDVPLLVQENSRLNMIRVSVQKKLGTFQIDAEFELNGVAVVGLFGPSGGGKTSIINMIAGIIEPDAGEIVIETRTLYEKKSHTNIPPNRRRIGYIFQESRLFPHLSVESNLKYGWKLCKPELRRIEYDHVVDLLGIGSILRLRPSKLSGGEKQRVAIGRALLTSPELMLMDEPLSSLDRDRKAELLPFIRRLTTELKIPTIYVSHSVSEISQLAEKIVMIINGKVGEILTPENLISRCTSDLLEPSLLDQCLL